MSFEDIFTPVASNTFSVERFQQQSLVGGFGLPSGTMEVISGSVLLYPQKVVYKSALVQTFINHTLHRQIALPGSRGMSVAVDAKSAWSLISYLAADIAIHTRCIGGTHVVCNQQVHDVLTSVIPSVYCKFIIDSVMTDTDVLIAYRGMRNGDGGYPYRDNGDGTVSLFDVHPLDVEYYRLMHVDFPTTSAQVKLNWKS